MSHTFSGRFCSGFLLTLVLSGCNMAADPDTPESGSPADDAGRGVDTGVTSEPAPVVAGTDLFNNYNISRDEYDLNARMVSPGILMPGDGVDMSDPGAPRRRADVQPLNLKRPKLMAAGVEDYTLSESFRLEEATSASAEAEILSAYFKGSYNIVSADAALDKAREERKNSRSIYAVIERRGQVEQVSTYVDGDQLVWRKDVKPRYEGTSADDRTFRRHFLLDYGSHYISSITYGYRVAIRGRITEKETTSDQKIKAAFKAAFVGGSAGGGVSDEIKNTLSSSSVQLAFEATSGGLYEDGEPRTGVLTRLEDILEMLEDIKAGRITIRAAPLHATAVTYWRVLPPEYSRSLALLEDHGADPIPDPVFGVPRGTVIPWNPPASAIRTDPDEDEYLVPPVGWAICNGEDGTPDLRNRFVRGTVDFREAGSVAGTDSHKHGASSAATDSKWSTHSPGMGSKYDVAKPGHTHPVTVEAGANVPAHVRLVYIMKL